MTPDEYLALSARTESPEFLFSNVDPTVLHGVIGLAGEAGEILDCIKKTMFYGQPLNKVNLKEELGDAMWYINQILRSQGWTLSEVMSENIDKLKLRYPSQFSTSDSINRKDKL